MTQTAGRPEPAAATTISVTEFRTELAKYVEQAHYHNRRFLVERNHEPFVILLGIDEYRRLTAASARPGAAAP